jgi:catechol 2,3-dioxygenase-like lactoylglutathione lyase family enzyme
VMIEGLGGVDHVAVLVRDLDRARDTWASLGFTLSPRGVHPVDLPGGGTGEAQFRTIQWPLDRVPAGMRIFDSPAPHARGRLAPNLAAAREHRSVPALR